MIPLLQLHRWILYGFVCSLPLMELGVAGVQVPELFLVAGGILTFIIVLEKRKISWVSYSGGAILSAGLILSLPTYAINSSISKYLAMVVGLLLITTLFFSFTVLVESCQLCIRNILKLLGFISLSLSVLNILQSFGVISGLGRTAVWVYDFKPFSGVQPSSVFIDIRGAYSSLVMLAFPIFPLNIRYGVLTDWPWRSRLFSLACTIIILFGIFLTGSRSSWISAIVSIILVLGMAWVKFSVRRTLFILGSVFLITLYFYQDIISIYESIVALRRTTVDTRFMLQRRAWGLFQENMYLGVDYGSISDLTLTGHWLHNAYLVLIFGAGTFGAIPFFVFILLGIVRGIRTYFAHVSIEKRIVAGGLLAGVSVSLVEWLAYGQLFNYASWLGLTLLYLSPMYRTNSQNKSSSH